MSAAECHLVPTLQKIKNANSGGGSMINNVIIIIASLDGLMTGGSNGSNGSDWLDTYIRVRLWHART